MPTDGKLNLPEIFIQLKHYDTTFESLSICMIAVVVTVTLPCYGIVRREKKHCFATYCALFPMVHSSSGLQKSNIRGDGELRAYIEM